MTSNSWGAETDFTWETNAYKVLSRKQASYLANRFPELLRGIKATFWKNRNGSKLWEPQPAKNSPNYMDTEGEICGKQFLGFF